jgi:hypothetical protein
MPVTAKMTVMIIARPSHPNQLISFNPASTRENRLWASLFQHVAIAARFDKVLLSMDGSIGKPRLYVNEELTTKYGVRYR